MTNSVASAAAADRSEIRNGRGRTGRLSHASQNSETSQETNFTRADQGRRRCLHSLCHRPLKENCKSCGCMVELWSLFAAYPPNRFTSVEF